MYKYLTLILLVLVFAACKKDSSNPASTSSGDYMVDWKIDNQSYKSTGIGSVGVFKNNTLAIVAFTGAAGGYPQLMVGVYDVTATGEYKWSQSNNTNNVGIVWATSQAENYSVTTENCNATINITEIGSNYVSGNFSGKLIKTNSAPNYVYVNVTGTFKVPKM